MSPSGDMAQQSTTQRNSDHSSLNWRASSCTGIISSQEATRHEKLRCNENYVSEYYFTRSPKDTSQQLGAAFRDATDI